MTFIASLWVAYGAMGHSGGISVAFFPGFKLQEHFSAFFSKECCTMVRAFMMICCTHVTLQFPTTEMNNYSKWLDDYEGYTI